MKPETAEKILVYILRTAGILCALAIVPMLMPASWSQSAYAAIDMGEIPDEPIVEYVTRSMSEMRALYGGLLLQLASNVHRCHQIIMYQAVGILVVAACATMLMYRLPIIGNYILLDCIPSLWLQTRLKEL